MNNPPVLSTYTPAEKPAFNDWAVHIQSQSIFSIAVREGMIKDPQGTIAMVREQYEDHPALVIRALGEKFIKKII